MAVTKIIRQEYLTSEQIAKWTSDYTININGSKGYITYLGIQGLPGVKFYLNSKDNSLYLNGLGFFELDLENTGASISSVTIDKASASSRAKNNPKGYLIIDYVLTNEIEVNN